MNTGAVQRLEAGNEEEPTQETGRGVRRGRADSQAGVRPEPRGKVLSEGKS